MPQKSDWERVQELQQALTTHKVNLARLEVQAASYGMSVPVSLSNEMDHARAEISRLEQEIATLRATLAPPAVEGEPTPATEPVVKPMRSWRFWALIVGVVSLLLLGGLVGWLIYLDNQPPRIDDLQATPTEIRTGQPVVLRVNAVDPRPGRGWLLYLWSADRGAITPSGITDRAIVLYVPPAEAVDVITVRVFNEKQQMTSRSLIVTIINP